jgi:hypothetical protein
VAIELKINLLEAAFRRCLDRVFFAADLDISCAVNECLTPPVYQNPLHVWHILALQDSSCVSYLVLEGNSPRKAGQIVNAPFEALNSVAISIFGLSLQKSIASFRVKLLSIA